MNALSQLKQDTSDIEETTDTLGGTGRSVLDTNVYTAKIKIVYTSKTKNGATGVNFIYDINGQEYKETYYVTNRNGEIFYKDSEGKKKYLAGYTHVNDIALLTTGKAIGDLGTEKKIVPVWDYQSKKEIPTEVDCITELHGKDVQLGISKEQEYKREEVNGEYVDVDEIIEKNSTAKVFHATHGKTVPECLAEKTEAEFINSWKDTWAGKVRDKTKGKTPKAKALGATAGMPSPTTAINTPTGKSLFN